MMRQSHRPRSLAQDLSSSIVVAALLAAPPAFSQLGPCTIETVAGGRSFVGVERPALEAELFSPKSMRTAPDGSLYIADTFHNIIRRVTPEGMITTVTGTGVPIIGE